MILLIFWYSLELSRQVNERSLQTNVTNPACINLSPSIWATPSPNTSRSLKYYHASPRFSVRTWDGLVVVGVWGAWPMVPLCVRSSGIILLKIQNLLSPFPWKHNPLVFWSVSKLIISGQWGYGDFWARVVLPPQEHVLVFRLRNWNIKHCGWDLEGAPISDGGSRIWVWILPFRLGYCTFGLDLALSDRILHFRFGSCTFGSDLALSDSHRTLLQRSNGGAQEGHPFEYGKAGRGISKYRKVESTNLNNVIWCSIRYF